MFQDIIYCRHYSFSPPKKITQQLANVVFKSRTAGIVTFVLNHAEAVVITTAAVTLQGRSWGGSLMLRLSISRLLEEMSVKGQNAGNQEDLVSPKNYSLPGKYLL